MVRFCPVARSSCAAALFGGYSFILYRANVISPGAVETLIIDGQFPTKEAADGAREWFKSIIPLGRLGHPEEIASAALFLASEESGYVVGHDLVVDGGATAI